MLMRILQATGIAAGVFLSACNQPTQEAGSSGNKEEFRLEDYIVHEGDMLIHKRDYEKFTAGIGRGPEIPKYLENPAYGPDGLDPASTLDDESAPLKKGTSQLEAAQRQLGTVVSASRIADVKIMLSGVPTEWVSHVDAAIAAYNQLSNSTAIRMRKVTSGADIVIGVNTGTSASNPCATAAAPTGGAPGSNITLYINQPHFKPNKALWTPAIIHELGHTIGLGHTNEGGTHIPTTPLTETASIMQGGSCASPAAGLTAYDHKALIYFYPPSGTRPWMRWDDYTHMDFVYSTVPTNPAIPGQGTPLYVINVGMIWTAPATGRVALYRFYSSSIRNHLYTTNFNEGQALVNQGLYVYEGITGYLMSSSASDRYPLNRYTNQGKHFYATGAGPTGYISQGVIGYIKSSLW